MPDLRDFLSRFRPAGAPGGARAGVPADRRRELEAEVGPVLALLAGTQAECERIIAQARRDAGRLTAETGAEAAAIAADAARPGALATAWPRLAQAASTGELRAALAASAWQDPGQPTPRAIRLGMRARWAARIAELGEPARTWAAGAAALLVAGERFASGRPAEPAVMDGALRLLGPAAAWAATPGELAGSVPVRARWVLTGITTPAELWRAETALMAGMERDGLRLLRAPGLESGTVLGAVAVMACHAWRIRAALELAARGGTPAEAYDELG